MLLGVAIGDGRASGLCCGQMMRRKRAGDASVLAPRRKGVDSLTGIDISMQEEWDTEMEEKIKQAKEEAGRTETNTNYHNSLNKTSTFKLSLLDMLTIFNEKIELQPRVICLQPRTSRTPNSMVERHPF